MLIIAETFSTPTTTYLLTKDDIFVSLWLHVFPVQTVFLPFQLFFLMWISVVIALRVEKSHRLALLVVASVFH